VNDTLKIYDIEYAKRLFMGTARYATQQQLEAAIDAASPALLTASVRRQLPAQNAAGAKQDFWQMLESKSAVILPNTAGCYSAHEAIETACMARELFGTNLIKLEVLGDSVNLQPDIFGLVEAAETLVKMGFHVYPYCTEDLVACRRLIDVGCKVLMPWGAPIGTGQGLRNTSGLRELRQRIQEVPLIVDAGLGVPSHACQVMEWGFDAVLVNTAISRATNPARMALAFDAAVSAGRAAWRSGPMAVRDLAVASTLEENKAALAGAVPAPAGVGA
jgi:thiazole synthase